MGSRKTRTTQVNKPVYAAEIGGAAKNVQDAYSQAQPGINTLSNNLGQVSNDLFAGMQGGNNAVLNANNFINQQLTGDPQDNPYLDRMIADTSDSLQRRIRTQLGTRGGIGGSVERDIVSGNLADSELALRYQDYNNAMNRRFQAAGMAPQGIQTATGLGQAGAMLPLQAGALNAASIGGLLGQYQDVQGTQRQSGGLLGQILGTAAQLGSTAIMACDVRLKENIERIGMTPGGVPLYRFDYIGGEKGVVGPMAHEVAILQPAALGPDLDGYMTVNVGMLQ